MGEDEWRVHHAGAPSLDHLRRRTLFSQREQVEERLTLNLRTPTDPSRVPSDDDCPRMRRCKKRAHCLRPWGTSPGSNIYSVTRTQTRGAGRRALIDQAKSFIERRGHGKIFTNLDSVMYLSLLRQVDMLSWELGTGVRKSWNPLRSGSRP